MVLHIKFINILTYMNFNNEMPNSMERNTAND